MNRQPGDQHLSFLRHALQLAAARQGFCAPNPSVGAVVVRGGEMVAEGCHWACGAPHAEPVALQAAGELAQGADLYVTLEPCCHYGRTPPCTEGIIKAGIKRVYYGYADPNPLVAGTGAVRLRDAGLVCERMVCPEIDTFYQSYAYWTKYKLPYVTYKIAQSLDGKIAGKAGQRLQLTGEYATQFTHEQRYHSDALLTTAATVIADDPLMTARFSEEPVLKPVFVLDRQLQIPAHAKLFRTGARVFLCYEQHLADLNPSAYPSHVNFLPLPSSPEGLSLPAVLQAIGEHGVQRVWVEAGGQLLHQFLRQQLAHRVFVYIAPKYLGEQAFALTTQASDLLTTATEVSWQALGQDALGSFQWQPL